MADLPSPSQPKRWTIAPPVGEQTLAGLPDLPALQVQLLHNRNITTAAAAREFLDGLSAGHNPFALLGMDAAVTRLRHAMRRGERIAVYGDFDADGITATALLVQVLTALGAQVQAYIPHRVDEGYGLNIGALRRLFREGVRLVVTVDCGVRSVDEIRQASRGLDVVVTDHHTPGPELPPAVSIVDPRQPGCAYPFKGLAGVGLAYKLAQALLRVQGQMAGTHELAEESLLDLVALGTVSDLAPLLDENRMLVRRGLALLNSSPRPGVEALMADAGLRRGEVDATAIGFRLGPRLNAAGRLDSALLAYRLLTGDDPLETRQLAGQLGDLNRRRQQLTEQIVAAAEAQVLSEQPEARLLLAADEQFLPGIVGLAASRLVETFYRPSVVVERGPEVSHGSCRSIPEFHITAALDQCADLLLRHGGHAAAAGFAVETRHLDLLRRRLQAMADEQLAGIELRPALHIDAELPLEEVNWATHALLQQMEPCGIGNPQPVFLSRRVQVREVRPVGSEQQHLRLALRDGRSTAWDAVWFRQGRAADALSGLVDVAYTLEVNEWNGQRRLQLNVQDLRPSATPP